MPSNNLLPSYIGSMVNQGAKLSAIRQRIGLEPQGTGMRELAPTNPQGPKYDVPSAGKHAMAAEDDFDPEGYEFPEEKRTAMLGAIQSFIDQYYPEDGMSEVSNPVADVPPDASAKQILDSDREKSGLAPMATFFREHKRLPSSEELKNLTAAKVIRVRLGRDPTEEEIALYRESPAKEAANARR